MRVDAPVPVVGVVQAEQRARGVWCSLAVEISPSNWLGICFACTLFRSSTASLFYARKLWDARVRPRHRQRCPVIHLRGV